MMDKEREAFEAWFSAQGFGTNRQSTGVYAETVRRHMWAAWQARAKQTITLPVKDATGEH